MMLEFSKMGGLVPAIVQDHSTGDVLMLAFMNEAAWLHTLKTGKATFWSRSRNSLWIKGETSGNVQLVKEIRVDCDNDTVLLKVEQVGGAACHTGHRSCFYKQVSKNGEIKIIGAPLFDPEEVYKK
jgi:phosphoribosyl-AMP cyclohydrolase